MNEINVIGKADSGKAEVVLNKSNEGVMEISAKSSNPIESTEHYINEVKEHKVHEEKKSYNFHVNTIHKRQKFDEHEIASNEKSVSNNLKPHIHAIHKGQNHPKCESDPATELVHHENDPSPFPKIS